MKVFNKKEGSMDVENWIIDASVDSDGHLTLNICHHDGSKVHILGADVSDETGWGDRFTTESIESEYKKQTG